MVVVMTVKDQNRLGRQKDCEKACRDIVVIFEMRYASIMNERRTVICQRQNRIAISVVDISGKHRSSLCR